jgi:hypothetical protein
METELLQSNVGEAKESVAHSIAAAPAEQQNGLVKKYLQEKLGSMFALVPEDIDATKRIIDFGVDSLMAIEVKVVLSNYLAVRS